MLFQGIQYGLGISIFKTSVKGEIENLILGNVCIIGIVLFQFFRAGVGHRGLPILLKAQPPIALRRLGRMALGYGFQGSFLCKMLLQPGGKMSGKESSGKKQDQLSYVEK